MENIGILEMLERTITAGVQWSENQARFAEILQELAKNPKGGELACIIPRGHGATTIGCIGLAAWAGMTGLKKRILIVRQHTTMSHELMDPIDEAATGLGVPVPEGLLITVSGLDYSVHEEYDLIICDALEDRREAGDEHGAQVLACVERLQREHLVEGGCIVWLGNLLYKGCGLELLHRRWEVDPKPGDPDVWGELFMQAIENDGNPMWPEMFTVERLEGIKELIGEDAFQAEYMNCPV